MNIGSIVHIKNESNIDPTLCGRIGICSHIEYIRVLNKTIINIRIPYFNSHVNIMLYDIEVDEIV
jgi:hypothetical protein